MALDLIFHREIKMSAKTKKDGGKSNPKEKVAPAAPKDAIEKTVDDLLKESMKETPVKKIDPSLLAEYPYLVIQPLNSYYIIESLKSKDLTTCG